jgi:hypothetical protein
MNSRKVFRIAGVLVCLGICLAVYAQYEREPKADMPMLTTEKTETKTSGDQRKDGEGWKELEKIIDRYALANLLITGEIKYYEEDTLMKVPGERETFTVAMTERGTMFEIDSVQTITQGNRILIVDKRDRSMTMIEQESGLNKNNPMNNLNGMLKEFRRFIQAIDVSGRGSEKILSIRFSDDLPGNIDRYLLKYEASTHRIREIRMDIREGDLIEKNTESADTAIISDGSDELVFTDKHNNEIPTGYFSDIKTNTYVMTYKTEKVIDGHSIDFSNWIKMENESYVPVGKYKTYVIVD